MKIVILKHTILSLDTPYSFILLTKFNFRQGIVYKQRHLTLKNYLPGIAEPIVTNLCSKEIEVDNDAIPYNTEMVTETDIKDIKNIAKNLIAYNGIDISFDDSLEIVIT